MNNEGERTKQRCVALGVTGSIAAYKAADLTSKMVQAGMDVHVLMTESGARLVQPQTFLTLSRNAVTTSLWDVPSWQPEHIALADRVAVLVVAPASANFLGKLAHGIADDALSTFALSHTGPVIVAPAMNPRMWQHPAVQANVALLRERGVVFVNPETGRVACSTGGTGRLADVAKILRAVQLQCILLETGHRRTRPLKVLVTAGPTREALDPVRYLTNRSSGKMGYALAEAATAMGHETVLVSGPVELSEPAVGRIVNVSSAAEMTVAVKDEFAACDLLLMCAAVADFRPVACSAAKIKKDLSETALPLARTEDILTSVAELKGTHQRILGFAAETDHVAEFAQEKRRRKKLDWIVSNDVSRADIGFGSDQNEAVMYSAAGEIIFPKLDKLELAVRLIAEAEKEFA